MNLILVWVICFALLCSARHVLQWLLLWLPYLFSRCQLCQCITMWTEKFNRKTAWLLPNILHQYITSDTNQVTRNLVHSELNTFFEHQMNYDANKYRLNTSIVCRQFWTNWPLVIHFIRYTCEQLHSLAQIH